MNRNGLMTLMFAIDLVVAVCCFILVLNKHNTPQG